jgi:hypothetical protein
VERVGGTLGWASMMGLISDSGRDAVSNLRALRARYNNDYDHVDMQEIPVSS